MVLLYALSFHIEFCVRSNAVAEDSGELSEMLPSHNDLANQPSSEGILTAGFLIPVYPVFPACASGKKPFCCSVLQLTYPDEATGCNICMDPFIQHSLCAFDRCQTQFFFSLSNTKISPGACKFLRSKLIDIDTGSQKAEIPCARKGFQYCCDGIWASFSLDPNLGTIACWLTHVFIAKI